MIKLLEHKWVKNGDLIIVWFDGNRLELSPTNPYQFYKNVYDERTLSRLIKNVYKTIPTLETVMVGNYHWNKSPKKRSKK